MLTIALVLWCVLFAILWATYYIGSSEGQLFLFPLIFIADGAVFVLAAIAVVVAIRSLVRGSRQRSRSVAVIVASALLILLGPVVLFFGNVFDPSIC